MVDNYAHFWQASWVFLRRDLQVRYASSILGPLWIVLYPLALVAITVVVFSFVFGDQAESPTYALHVIIGFVHWLFFSQSILKIVYIFPGNVNLIKNHRFPLLALPVSALLSRFVDYLVGLAILGLAMAILGHSFSLGSLLFFALLLVVQIFFQFGLGLLFATLNLLVRDIQHLVEILLQVWFYATPVIYTLAMLPSSIAELLVINPLTTLFSTYRQLVLGGTAVVSPNLSWVIVSSLLVFVGGLWFFQKNKHQFAELL